MATIRQQSMNRLRLATKVQLMRTQGSLCPLCRLRPVSDLHEIVYPKGVGQGGKYDLDDEFGEALFAPGNCLLLCNYCNVNVANSVTIVTLIQLKMSLPGVEPADVAAAVAKVAGFSKLPRHCAPATVEYDGRIYHILQ